MSSPAAIVVIQDRSKTIYFGRHLAASLDYILARGPDEIHVTLGNELEIIDPGTLSDYFFESGGAVIDYDNMVLMWHGGNDIYSHFHRYDCMIQVMKITWQGWSKTHLNGRAYLEEIVDYSEIDLGCDGPFNFPRSFNSQLTPSTKTRKDKRFFPGSVGTIRLASGLLMDGAFEGADVAGDLIDPSLDIETAKDLVQSCQIRGLNSPQIAAGFHINIAEKILFYWGLMDLGIGYVDVSRVEENWIGYKVIDWERDFSKHKALTPELDWNNYRNPQYLNWLIKIGVASPFNEPDEVPKLLENLERNWHPGYKPVLENPLKPKGLWRRLFSI